MECLILDIPFLVLECLFEFLIDSKLGQNYSFFLYFVYCFSKFSSTDYFHSYCPYFFLFKQNSCCIILLNDFSIPMDCNIFSYISSFILLGNFNIKPYIVYIRKINHWTVLSSSTEG